MLSIINSWSTAALGGAPFRLSKCTALGSAGGAAGVAGAWLPDHVHHRRRGRRLLLRHGGGRRGHGTRDAADHGRVSGLLRGRRRALGNGGGICRPVPGAEHFLRAGAVCLRQCVHLAGASVLAYPGGCDLRAADAGCPGICGPHRPPGQPGKMA